MLQQPFPVQALVVAGQPLQQPVQEIEIMVGERFGKVQVVETPEVAGQFDGAVSVGFLDDSDFPSAIL